MKDLRGLRGRYVLVIAAGAAVAAACAVPPLSRGGGDEEGGCSTTSCADGGTEAATSEDGTAPEASAAIDASPTVDASTDDAATASDAEAEDDGASDAGPVDEDAGSEVDAGGTPDAGGDAGADASVPVGITCKYTALRSELAACAACNIPPEETIVKEDVTWSIGPVRQYCRSASGTAAARSVDLGISDLLAKIDGTGVWTASYQLAGAPPSESYKWLMWVPGCGPVLGGGGDGTTISVVNGVMKVNLKLTHNPSVFGCPIQRGCFRKLLVCTGTVAVP